MIERFEEGGKPLLTVFRFRQPGWAEGAEFFTAPDELLQVGLLARPAGHAVPVHAHNPVERLTIGTAEFLYVLDGMIEVTAFGEGRARRYRLGAGDAALVHPGTVHKVVWTADARVIEVKTGPYEGREEDKDDGTLSET